MFRRLSATVIAFSLVACGNPEPEGPTVEEQAYEAKTLFWEVFNAGAYERIPEAQEKLLAAYEKDLSDKTMGETAMLLGVSHYWNAAEWRRDLTRPNSGQYQAILKTDEYLTVALEYRPNDARVMCWLGGAKTFRSQVERNPALFDEGLVLINKCATIYPSFGLIMKGFIGSFMPVESDMYQDAITSIWKNVDVCIDKEIDRVNPAFQEYMHLTSNLEGQYLACWNGPTAPHNLEGFWLFMGDLLTKVGQPEQAKIIYNNALLVQDVEKWPYYAKLTERIATVDERAALYGDSDMSNDPPMLPQTTYQCVLCHQK
jgi:tetratricopeptide (TPR) repeat protein